MKFGSKYKQYVIPRNKNCLFICLLVTIIIFITYYLFASIAFLLLSSDYNVEPIDGDPSLHILKIKEDTDQEWLPILRYGKIEQIINLENKVHGLADKFKVVFSSGHQGIAKLVEPFSLFEKDWSTYSSQVGFIGEVFYPRRSGRKMQGWPEVAAGAVARVMGGRFKTRKIPSAIRPVSSKALYGCVGCHSPYDKLKAMLPEHEVYISITAWFSSLVTTPPSLTLHKYLVNPFDLQIRARDTDNAGDISDTIVFDYIVDDHDRHAQHNWMSDGYGTLLLWDNGLSFNHGPQGRDSCKNLLCGPDTWKDQGKVLFDAPTRHCKKICRFRNSTIARLRELTDPNIPKELRIKARLEKEIKEEGSPVFEFNTYYAFPSRYPKIKYYTSDFYYGIESRIVSLLHHVDNCIEIYGELNVLGSLN